MNSKDINERDNIGVTALFTAVAYDKIAEAKRLLEKHADPNIPDHNGTTPLMNAAAVGNEDMVKLLLSFHADPNRKDDFGHRAAGYARNEGYEKLAVFLEAAEHKAGTGNEGSK